MNRFLRNFLIFAVLFLCWDAFGHIITAQDSASAMQVPDFVPANHPLAFVWQAVVSGLASLLFEGFQLMSIQVNKMKMWPKRIAVGALNWATAALLSLVHINIALDPFSMTGAGATILAGGLLSFGVHQVLFQKKV